MVTLIQTEQTFNVVDELGNEYTATIITDLPNAFIQYDIFDDDGEEIEEDDLRAHIISIIEETL